MLPESLRADIAAATVSFGVGQGVLIPGNLILTATHVLDVRYDGMMTVEELACIHKITTSKGKKLLVEPVAVEPVSDVAVLGPVTHMDLFEDSNHFYEFCENTKPVTLLRRDPQPLVRLDLDSPPPEPEESRIYIYTHKGTWITGVAKRLTWRGDPGLWLEMDDPMEAGSSGGPIVNDSGQIVGVVAHGSDVGRTYEPHLALPVWVCRKIFDAEKMGQKPDTLRSPEPGDDNGEGGADDA